jgi:hypothetical protein
MEREKETIGRVRRARKKRKREKINRLIDRCRVSERVKESIYLREIQKILDDGMEVIKRSSLNFSFLSFHVKVIG